MSKPIKVLSDDLNSLLQQCDFDTKTVITEELIARSEANSFTPYIGYTISNKTRDYHKTDSQLCEYKVIIKKPGLLSRRHKIYSDVCLCIGWNFSGDEKGYIEIH